ncbi:MAG: hypothetical protein M0P20_08155 [Methanocorpusculum sp.]|nr:hypothetical protein [Methanocorpusculum sp.]
MEGVTRAIWKDFQSLKMMYPELEMCVLEAEPRIAIGTVTLPELRTEPREVRARLSLPIWVVYPDNFPNQEIRVFDVGKIINWELVSEEHRHDTTKGLCTHHSEELKYIRHKENESILIVRSAILLYLAYLECVKNGKWPVTFKDLPHNPTDALKILNRMQRRG